MDTPPPSESGREHQKKFVGTRARTGHATTAGTANFQLALEQFDGQCKGAKVGLRSGYVREMYIEHRRPEIGPLH